MKLGHKDGSSLKYVGRAQGMQFPGEADTERRLRISETVLGGEGAEKGKMCHREREKMEDERI